MYKNMKKLALPAIAAAGALIGSSNRASADLIVSITQAATNSGGYDVYTMAVLNNGLDGTGTNINTISLNLRMASSGFIKMDNSKSIDGDTAPDINLLGASDAFGSTIGTFMVGPNTATASSYHAGALIGPGDSLQGVYLNHYPDTQSGWSSKANFQAGLGRAYNTIYDSLTSLEIDEGLNLPAGGTYAAYHGATPNTPIEDFANIVVPHGASFSLAGSVGAPMFASKAVPALNWQFVPLEPPPIAGPVVLLQTAAPTYTGAQIHNGSGGTTGTPLGNYNPLGGSTSTLTVTNTGPGGYDAGYINGLTPGTNAGYTSTAGFSASDLEIFLLNIKIGGADPSSADESQFVSDINAYNSASVIASLVTDPNLTNLGGIAWDVELQFAAPASANGYFGFNFSSETDLSGAVTVTDIAAIPEPAGAGLLLLGGLGLLSRRKRHLTV